MFQEPPIVGNSFDIQGHHFSVNCERRTLILARQERSARNRVRLRLLPSLDGLPLERFRRIFKQLQPHTIGIDHIR